MRKVIRLDPFDHIMRWFPLARAFFKVCCRGLQFTNVLQEGFQLGHGDPDVPSVVVEIHGDLCRLGADEGGLWLI